LFMSADSLNMEGGPAVRDAHLVVLGPGAVLAPTKVVPSFSVVPVKHVLFAKCP
jgi:hypothetical protein